MASRLKTVDQYFSGARNDIQRAVVQSIISNVVTELSMNPDRKFICECGAASVVASASFLNVTSVGRSALILPRVYG